MIDSRVEELLQRLVDELGKKNILVYPIEFRTLKRKPKRIDFIIAPNYDFQMDYETMPINKWIYFTQGDRHWKVRRVVK